MDEQAISVGTEDKFIWVSVNIAGNLAKEPLVTHMMMKTCILYFYANGLFGVDKQRFICAFIDTLGFIS